MRTKETGYWGENTAAEFLKKKGYEVIKQNFATRTGEIDIIAKDGEFTVFVEVKTRKNPNFGHGSEYVDLKKQRKIISAAYSYLEENIDIPIRFDIVEVYYYETKDGPKIRTVNHIENAFIT